MSQKMHKTPHTIYLIDASIYIFRAYFALPESLRDELGRPMQAVHGFADFLHGMSKTSRGKYFALAFDGSLTSCFRNEIYPSYKANRTLPDNNLMAQLEACRKLAQAMGYYCLSSTRFEADDLIGSLAMRVRRRGHRPVIISSDKDLAQLVGTGEYLWDYARDERLFPKHIKARFGVNPAQIPALLALAGDSADNIPGLPGIGHKSAVPLLQRYGDLDGIYRNLQHIRALKLRGAARIARTLEEQRVMAYRFLSLTRIRTDIQLPCALTRLQRKKPDIKSLKAQAKELGFDSRLYSRLAPDT